MIVRKAVSMNLKEMIQCIECGYPEKEAISLFQAFSKDPQDLVRFPCVDSLIALCTLVPSQVCILSNDRKRRVM